MGIPYQQLFFFAFKGLNIVRGVIESSRSLEAANKQY